MKEGAGGAQKLAEPGWHTALQWAPKMGPPRIPEALGTAHTFFHILSSFHHPTHTPPKGVFLTVLDQQEEPAQAARLNQTQVPEAPEGWSAAWFPASLQPTLLYRQSPCPLLSAQAGGRPGSREAGGRGRNNYCPALLPGDLRRAVAGSLFLRPSALPISPF